MKIENLGRKEAISLLDRTGFGRLASSKDGQPYVIPLHFSVDGDDIYTFSTAGRKIEWMRINPLVCIQADEIETSQRWKSVVVFGRYHEISASSEGAAEREKVHRLLEGRRGTWWEPGYAKTVLDGVTRPLDTVYFRISIESISGHTASL